MRSWSARWAESRRADRRPEALVGRLVAVEGRGHGAVGGVARAPALDAVVGQRRVEDCAPDCDGAHEALDERSRRQIEEGRRRDEIDVLAERGFEIGGEVDPAKPHRNFPSAFDEDEVFTLIPGGIRPAGEGIAGCGEQRRVVVGKRPALALAQERRGRAQVRARAAAEVDDREAGAGAEAGGERVGNLGVAGAGIGRLAQRQPLRRERAHASRSRSAAATRRAVSFQVGSLRPASQDTSASRVRSLRLRRSEAIASESALTSPGGP